MENSDDDVEDAADRKRKRAEKKAERKRMNEVLVQAEAEGRPLDVAATKEVVEPIKKKRGRPSSSVTPSVTGDEVPTKKRKMEKVQGPEVQLMTKLFIEVNKLKSDLGEDLNQFFLVPVNRKVSVFHFCCD